jgi:hypothetical protein
MIKFIDNLILIQLPLLGVFFDKINLNSLNYY